MRKGINAFLLAMALAAPAASQTVDEIVAKNIVATGGLEKIKAVGNVNMHEGRPTQSQLTRMAALDAQLQDAVRSFEKAAKRGG